MICGGSTKYFAAISATTSLGAALSCTNGSKTFTAKDTSGQWMFIIPSVGTWTVTATKGSESKSVSVNITTEGQHESVSLILELVLFADGVAADVTGGFNFINDGTLTAYASGNNSSANSNAVYSKGLIDLSGYTTLHFQVTASDGGGNNYRYLGVSSVANSGNVNNYLARVISPAVGEVTLDISNISVPVAILIAVSRWGTTWSSVTLTVTRVWAT